MGAQTIVIFHTDSWFQAPIKKNTRQGNVFCSKHTCVQWYSRCGSVAGTWLSQEEGRKSRKLKALMTGPSGRDHKLSQLAAERLVLNSDPACCTFVLQRDLILFIKPGVAYSMLSTAYNYTSISGRARPQMVQLQFHFSVLTFGGERQKKKGIFGEEEIWEYIRFKTPLWLENFPPLDTGAIIILTCCGLYYVKSVQDFLVSD